MVTVKFEVESTQNVIYRGRNGVTVNVDVVMEEKRENWHVVVGMGSRLYFEVSP